MLRFSCARIPIRPAASIILRTSLPKNPFATTSTTQEPPSPPSQQADAEVEMPSPQVRHLASKIETPLATSEKQQVSLAENAKFVFEQAWSAIEKICNGRQNIRLPDDIIWLMGAPGSGKGTVTPALCKARGLTNRPIVIGHILRDPSIKALMDRGEMVSDQVVLELLLKAMISCDSESGVLVDGFPRTEIQVECLKLLHGRMHALRQEFANTPLSDKFRRPTFRITVLYVDEAESIKRQLKRGRQVKEHNELARLTGQGELLKERVTDSDENLLRARYKVFTQHFGALMLLKKLFPFHLISSDGPVDDVIRKVWQEFEYQSSLELEQSTFNTIEQIPLAEQIGLHARQELCRRLDGYQNKSPENLKRIVSIIEKQFVPTIKRHAISGSARIRLDESQVSWPEDIDILMDVMSERGFRISVDCRKELTPIRIQPETMEIINKEENVVVFEVRFQRNLIRGVFGGEDQNDPRDHVNEVSSTEPTLD